MPQLDTEVSNLSYKMVFCREYNDMLKKLKKVSAEGGEMPVLMFLYKEKG